jgi:uncharacterized membrane protein YdjX (TVP38/TMEM64 family)/pimeloyl-ACP methyl ester carboxylesterase
MQIVNPYGYLKRFRTILMLELLLLTAGGTFAYHVWATICEGGFSQCFSQGGNLTILKYLALGLLRPFTLFPQFIFEVLGAKAWNHAWAPWIMALSSILSWLVVFALAKIIGKKIITPWLSANLPQTHKFLRSQDWKITLLTRTIPFVPFDLLSLSYGLLDFRWKTTLIATALTTIPESYIIYYSTRTEGALFKDIVLSLVLLSVFYSIPGLIWEYRSRRQGGGLWIRLKAMWSELLFEVKTNNDIVKRQSFTGDKVPILLLYGFFSSRRSLSVIERHLKAKGYEVISFNLGGLLGVFFTRGIIETAHFIDFKLKKQFERYSFNKITVVAHSKGGLVALWWLLRLGGFRYCDRVITMGTPYKGTKLTWLLLITPIGFLWRDMWQMRPGSRMLKVLSESYIPESVKIFCFYSEKDRVSSGTDGIFKAKNVAGQVIPVAMHHISHFEYLHKRDVAEEISKLLGPPESIVRQANVMDRVQNES